MSARARRASAASFLVAILVAGEHADAQTPPSPLPPTQPPTPLSTAATPIASASPHPTSAIAPQLQEVNEEKASRQDRERDSIERSRERDARRSAWEKEKARPFLHFTTGLVKQGRSIMPETVPVFGLGLGAVIPLSVDFALQGRAVAFLTPPYDEVKIQRAYRNGRYEETGTDTESRPFGGSNVDATLRFQRGPFVVGVGPFIGYLATGVTGGGTGELGARFGSNNELEVVIRPSLGSFHDKLLMQGLAALSWSPLAF